MRVLVVGAGFFGLTVAERISSQLGVGVDVIDRREHIGGNAHSEIEPVSGIEVHRYGIHIFHTSNQKVWDYVKQFTDFNSYKHHVRTVHRGEVFPMPISLATINQFYRSSMSPNEARNLVSRQTEGIQNPINLEEKAIASVGRDLYEAFIKGYTEKQWGTDPRMLPPETIARLPVRFNMDTRYFNDAFEGQPLEGYNRWHYKMVDNPLIKVFLGTDYFYHRDKFDDYKITIFTGPIDEFFEYRFGELGWRTLDFKTKLLRTDDFQGCSQLNYADSDVPWTRVLEFKHLHPEREHKAGYTVITKEFPRKATKEDEVYYPINSPADRERLLLYRAEARKVKGVFWGGGWARTSISTCTWRLGARLLCLKIS